MRPEDDADRASRASWDRILDERIARLPAGLADATARAGAGLLETDDREPLTEAGAAERFARLHGEDLRYDHRRQRWLVWHGHRWVPDVDGAVTRIALDFVRRWQHAALDLSTLDQRQAALKLALGLERRERLASVLTLAQDLQPIAVSGEAWDMDPWLVGTPNGVVDLRIGTLRPGRRDDGITMSTAVALNPSARCPRFETFIAEVFNHDLELVGFAQRAIGYSLSGSTGEQVFFVPFGTGSNGKGTLLNTMRRAVFGDYGHALAFSALEYDPRPGAASNELAALVGKRLVVASEASEDRRLDEGRIKWITGEDPIRARFLYAESFEFLPTSKFWLSVNHKPIVLDDSSGFWRRVRLIPFARAFPIDLTLAGRLAAEAPGLLAWAVRGCLDWQRIGLNPPGLVLDATSAYRRESDALGAFLDEATELDAGAEVGARDLFEHYRKWADAQRLNDKERLTATGFGRKLAERFTRQKRGPRNVYLGLARKDDF